MSNNKTTKQDIKMEEGKPIVSIVEWDDSEMETTYANVINASCTKEEVALFFGTNKTWNPNEKGEYHVHLNDRIIMNPHAAKRLEVLLGAVLKQYEDKFGPLRATEILKPDVGVTIN